MRHANKDSEILAKRHQVYQNSKAKRPERWSGNTRNWSPITDVALNPTNKEEVKSHKATSTLKFTVVRDLLPPHF